MKDLSIYLRKCVIFRCDEDNKYYTGTIVGSNDLLGTVDVDASADGGPDRYQIKFEDVYVL